MKKTTNIYYTCSVYRYLALRDKERRTCPKCIHEQCVFDKKAKVTTSCWSANGSCKNAVVPNMGSID